MIAQRLANRRPDAAAHDRRGRARPGARAPAAVALLAAVAAAVGVAFAILSALRPAHGAGGAASSLTAQTVISGRPVGPPVPAGFVGISIELRALEQYAGTDPRSPDPVLLALIRQIAPGQRPVLRLGGDSTDWSWWPVPGMARPGGVRYALTPLWMQVARSLAGALDARLILGVNLEADSPRVAAAEGQAMVSGIGRRSIAALEIGNEPELYGSFGWYRNAAGREVPGRPPGYDLSDFIGEFHRFARVLPDVPLAGPSSGAPAWLAQLSRFVGEAPRLRLVTVHAYPLKHCRRSTVVTIAQLLSAAAFRGLAARLAGYVRVAARAHLPLRVDEFNAVSCGGTRGVSDSFASALWILDALFELERAGVAGVNVHSVPNTINEVLGPELVDGSWRMRVHPEYYGMIMFAQAAPPGSRLLAVRASLPRGIDVWATRSPSGGVHVLLVDRRLRGSSTVALRIAWARAPASLERLQAPSAAATSGVTLGGRTFGAATATGELAGEPANLVVQPTAGLYSVRLPAASAALLTIPPS
ncbi:MAG TPA: glycosyl hydrolase family 79 C-terminal domain-containing protein [Solirubrobacteraceae bacterium]|nr:glycosyl hydrolase family 79 C-terminal domain-containing protein [Solirubrobacteraceae bacterium]